MGLGNGFAGHAAGAQDFGGGFLRLRICHFGFYVVFGAVAGNGGEQTACQHGNGACSDKAAAVLVFELFVSGQNVLAVVAVVVFGLVVHLGFSPFL